MGAKEDYETRKREAKAREYQKRPWYKQPNPIDRFTGWLVVWTALLFLGTIGSVFILYKTDKTFRETLIANERPWIDIEVRPVSDFIYDKGAVSVEFEFTFKNVGKTPALYVLTEAKMFPESILYLEDILRAQKEVCEKNSSIVDLGIGYMIFPNKTFKTSYYLIIDKKTMTEYLNKKKVSASSDTKRTVYIKPSIFVCANYRFIIGPHEIHRTTVLAHLLWDDPRLKGHPFDIELGAKTIPLDQLRIDRTESFFGEYAN